MSRLLPLGAFGLLVIIAGFAIWQFGESKYREGRLAAINAQLETNSAHQTAVMAARNEIDTKLMESIPSIYDADDGATTGASIAKWLSEPTIPARKPLPSPQKAEPN